MKGWLTALVWLIPVSGMAKGAPDFDPSADPGTLAATFVEADKLKALRGVQRVAISQFRVEFAVENDAKSSSSSTMGWSSAASDIKLVGITDEARQAIADQLFDKLVNDLTAAGLEVVPFARVEETDSYKSLSPVLHTQQEPLGTRSGKSIFVGARGMPPVDGGAHRD